MWAPFLFSSGRRKNRPTGHPKRPSGCAGWVVLGLFLAVFPCLAEEHLASLTVGDDVYNNVTVTSVTATDIYFSHSRGMGNAKLKNLSPEWQKHFHFDPAKAGAAEKKQVQANAQFRAGSVALAKDVTTKNRLEGLPFPAVVVITEETQSRFRIRQEALKLLLSKDYDRLDQLAHAYRLSKEAYPDGTWKLAEIYYGLEPEEAAPDVAWERRLAVLEDWVKERPDSISARVAWAQVQVAYAWKARGTGYMNTISTAAYRTFVTRARLAMGFIDAAAGLKEKCPFGTMAVVTAARGIGARDEQFWRPLYAGIADYPGFVEYYSSAFTYLLPRWFGKVDGDSEFFLKRHADKLGGEEGDVLYARVAWMMDRANLFSNPITENHLSWERIDKGFRVLEQRYPDALSVKSAHARLAGYTAGAATTRALIEQLNGKVDFSVWTPLDQFREHVRFAYGPNLRRP